MTPSIPLAASAPGDRTRPGRAVAVRRRIACCVRRPRRMRFALSLLASAVLIPAALLQAQSPGSTSASGQNDSASRNASSGNSSSSNSSNAAPSVATLSAPSGYILSPNDQVAVEVFGEEDLRTNGRLNGEGNLSVPLLGSIHMAGLNLSQAASRLTDLYGRDYLVNPKVNVMLIGYAKRRFTMLGQINRPGSYEMPDGSPEGIDLLEAIAMAGGYTRIAAPEKVSVKRGNQVVRVDAKRQAKGNHGAFTIVPGDTVTVGESIF